MRFAVPDHVHYRELQDEIVLLDTRADAFLGLNATAAVVWTALAAGKSTADAVDALVQQFGVSEEIARRDVASLTSDLEARGLLKRAVE